MRKYIIELPIAQANYFENIRESQQMTPTALVSHLLNYYRVNQIKTFVDKTDGIIWQEDMVFDTGRCYIMRLSDSKEFEIYRMKQGRYECVADVDEVHSFITE